MPYPKNLIQEGETVALDLRPHWWYFSRNILTGIPLFIICLILVLQRRRRLGHEVRRLIVGRSLVAWAVWLVLKYLQWRMTYFVVTSRRVIYRTGVISKRGVEIPLERINNINFHQRLIDRIIGAGDLDIESAGQGRPDPLRLHPPPRRRAARDLPPDGDAQHAAECAPAAAAPAAAARRRPARPACPSRSSSSRALRDQGHITAAEFEEKKAELLGRM